MFAEIDDDAKEVGHEILRLVMEQVTDQQAEAVPSEALTTETGEPAQWIGTQERRLETESGPVSRGEPQACLPRSRKAFFPQSKALGLSVDEDLSPALLRKSVHLATKLPSFESARKPR